VITIGEMSQPRSAGHHDPAAGGVLDRVLIDELIEPRQERDAPDEARVSRSFRRKVDPRPLGRRGRGYRGSELADPPPMTC
jgi:hypothetical protein